MGEPDRSSKKRKGGKTRVAFRSNRSRPARRKNWMQQVNDADGRDPDASHSESIVAKGDLSRHRTVTDPGHGGQENERLQSGTVLVVRGLYADVDDGSCVWRCTIRRVLRTRLIGDRHPVTVGDRVRFRREANSDDVARDGVIESVEGRKSQLCRRVGRRIQVIGANVDYAVIVTSAADPYPKPQLIDRYIVAAQAGQMTPVVCVNKIDLDQGGGGHELCERYGKLGYTTLSTSAVSGAGIDRLRAILKDCASLFAGQSGVGKSSLLNAVQPALALRVCDVSLATRKGRHTTATARLIRLDMGGYVVDTPGVRTLDLTIVPRNEFESHFIEFREHVAHCRFPDCTHTHEEDCAVKAAVEQGDIHPERYESYVRLFTGEME